jgi:hypothetical protein
MLEGAHLATSIISSITSRETGFCWYPRMLLRSLMSSENSICISFVIQILELFTVELPHADIMLKNLKIFFKPDQTTHRKR